MALAEIGVPMRPCLDDSTGGLQPGSQEGVRGIAQLNPMLGGGRHDRLCLFNGEGERLFPIDMLACANCLQRNAGVDRRDRQIHDQLDFWHGENGLEIAGMRDPIFGGLSRGAAQVDVRASQYGKIREADKIRQVLIADVATAYDGDSDGFKVVAHVLSFLMVPGCPH